jgi:hypothetical protein
MNWGKHKIWEAFVITSRLLQQGVYIVDITINTNMGKIVNYIMKSWSTRAMNLIPIFGGFKAIAEVIRWKQYLSNIPLSPKWRLFHILEGSCHLGTYALFAYNSYNTLHEDYPSVLEWVFAFVLFRGAKLGHAGSLAFELLNKPLDYIPGETQLSDNSPEE